jgi:hypothetical protein
MSGRPKLQELDARIHELGGDDYIFDKMRDGMNPKAIAADLGVSRGMLYHWRNLDATGERERKWTAAMSVKLEVGLDEGGEILDSLTANNRRPTTAEVQAANAQANWRREMAKMLDPERFDRASTPFSNPAELLLEALKIAGTARSLPKPAPLTLTAEIINESETNEQNS